MIVYIYFIKREDISVSEIGKKIMEVPVSCKSDNNNHNNNNIFVSRKGKFN